MRLCDFLLKASGIVCGLRGQRRQMYINPHQSLQDGIVQFAADVFSFLFLRVQKFVGQMPQPLLGLRQGLFQRLSPDNFLL